ncbi:MAG TPA: thermostable hemolysin, partial [Gammaproteobacteria bacterium]|nr:thermostable hemolysin [Gammaproteobacteria bacterium]
MDDTAMAWMPASKPHGVQLGPFAIVGAQTAAIARQDVALDARVPERSLRLVPHGRGSPRRREIEAFIRAEYREHFGADVREFMPTLIALHDTTDRICAAVGCRSAALEPLFLEIYADEHIESLIAERTGVAVRRERIVEIGSLACRDGRAAFAIVRALVPFLIGAGFTWVAFTGADTVVSVLRRLKLEPLALCVADGRKLGAARHTWGSYY